MENNAAEIILAERRNEKRQSPPEIRDYRLVSWVRLILRITSMLTCALIVMSLVDAVRKYQKTKHVRNAFQEGSGSFSVWPEQEGLKMYPSYILLGAAIVAGVFSFVLVLAALTKAVSASRALRTGALMLTTAQVRRMTIENISTMVVSALCLVLWVAVTAYYGTWDTSETNWDLL